MNTSGSHLFDNLEAKQTNQRNLFLKSFPATGCEAGDNKPLKFYIQTMLVQYVLAGYGELNISTIVPCYC